MSKVFTDRKNWEKVHINNIVHEKYVRFPDNYINIINPVLGEKSRCWGVFSLKKYYII